MQSLPSNVFSLFSSLTGGLAGSTTSKSPFNEGIVSFSPFTTSSHTAVSEKSQTFKTIYASFIEKDRADYTGIPDGFSAHIVEGGTISRDKAMLLQQKLKDNNAQEYSLTAMNQLIASGNPLSLGTIISKLSGQSRLGEELTDDERATFRLLITKAGTNILEADAMLAQSDAGQNISLWNTLAQKFSSMDFETIDISKEEMTALVKSMDISPANSKLILEQFPDEQPQTFSKAQLSELFGGVRAELATKENAIQQVQTIIRPSIDATLQDAAIREKTTPVADIRSDRTAERLQNRIKATSQERANIIGLEESEEASYTVANEAKKDINEGKDNTLHNSRLAAERTTDAKKNITTPANASETAATITEQSAKFTAPVAGADTNNIPSTVTEQTANRIAPVVGAGTISLQAFQTITQKETELGAFLGSQNIFALQQQPSMQHTSFSKITRSKSASSLLANAVEISKKAQPSRHSTQPAGHTQTDRQARSTKLPTPSDIQSNPHNATLPNTQQVPTPLIASIPSVMGNTNSLLQSTEEPLVEMSIQGTLFAEKVTVIPTGAGNISAKEASLPAHDSAVIQAIQSETKQANAPHIVANIFAEDENVLATTVTSKGKKSALGEDPKSNQQGLPGQFFPTKHNTVTPEQGKFTHFLAETPAEEESNTLATINSRSEKTNKFTELSKNIFDSTHEKQKAEASGTHSANIGQVEKIAGTPVPVAGENFTPAQTASTDQYLANLARNHRQEVFQQVQNGLLQTSKNGTTSLTLQLDPKDLGQLTLMLEMRGGELRAIIQAERPEAAAALSEQLEHLKNTLEEQGLKVAELQVRTGLQDSTSSSQEWAGTNEHNLLQEERDRAQRLARLRHSDQKIEEHLVPGSKNQNQEGLHVVA